MVNSISELYSFMDGADATLALKVLGEVDENGQPVAEAHAAGKWCRSHTLSLCVARLPQLLHEPTVAAGS